MRAMAYFSEYSIVSGAQGSGGSDCGVRVETLILCEEDYATVVPQCSTREFEYINVMKCGIRVNVIATHATTVLEGNKSGF